MSVVLVEPEIDHSVRGLCVKPYYNHPKGCPNFNKRPSCPPQAPLLDKILNLSKPIHIAYNRFDLAQHVRIMKSKHSTWSQRQLECCLYWQGKARKQLRLKVEAFLENNGNGAVLYCPEACGVDITKTMRSIGIKLEWPPKIYTYQVALIGTLNG
jgi:predicted metal-binding protein